MTGFIRIIKFANRFAVLAFLTKHNIPARLLCVYFTGDKRPDGAICPENKEEWTQALLEQHEWLGLGDKNLLSRVHKVFLPVLETK